MAEEKLPTLDKILGGGLASFTPPAVKTRPDTDSLSYLGGVVASTFTGATTDFVGGTPDADVIAFRKENPGTGFITSLAGMLLPSIPLGIVSGGLALPAGLARVATFANAIQKTSKLSKTSTNLAKGLSVLGTTGNKTLLGTAFATKPIASQAAKFAAIGGVEELARFGIAGGLESLGANASARQVAREIPFTITGAAAIGAGLRAGGQVISHATRGAKRGEAYIASKFPEYDVTADPQRRLQTLARLRREHPAVLGNDLVLRNAFEEVESSPIRGKTRESVSTPAGLRFQIRAQLPKKGVRAHVGKLQDSDKNAFHRHLNAWFKPNGTSTRMVFNNSEVSNNPQLAGMGFEEGMSVEAALNRAELPSDWESHVLFPRFILNLKKPKAAGSGPSTRDFRSQFLRNLKPLDGKKGFYWAKEESTGLYIIAKKLRNSSNIDVKATQAELGKNAVARQDLAKAKAALAKQVKATKSGKKKERLGGEIADLDEQISANTARGKELEDILVNPENFGGAPDANDWIIFKTDDVGFFEPDAAVYKKAQEQFIWDTGNEFHSITASLAATNQVLDQQLQALNAIPRYTAMKQWTQRQVLDTLNSVLPAKTIRNLRNLSEIADSNFKDVFAPAMFSYTRYPLAASTARRMFKVYELAQAEGYKKFTGGAEGTLAEAGKSAFNILRARPTKRGGVEGLIDRLNAKDLEGINKFLDEGVDPALGLVSQRNLVAELGISVGAARVIKTLDKLDNQQLREYFSLSKYLGITPEFQGLPNHLMMVRTWEGNIRLPIFLKNADGTPGRPVYIIGSRTGNDAMRIAQDVEKELKKIGIDIMKPEDVNIAGRLEDAETFRHAAAMSDMNIVTAIHREVRRSAKASKPGRLKQRSDVSGASLVKNRKELKEKIFTSIQEMERYKARLITDNLLQDDFARILRDRPDMFNDLMRRKNMMDGGQGPLSKQINDVVDKILLPLMPELGPGSATKVTQALNAAMFHLTLGAFDTGFPAMNAATFVQTVAPENALLLTGDLDRIASLGYYDINMIPGPNGTTRPAGMLTPAKLVIQAFRELKNPSAELADHINRGVADGTIAPSMAEALLGSSTDTVAFSKVLSGEEGIIDWLKGLSTFMPTKSEEFARLHAFTDGHIVGRDIFNKSGEELYDFTKNFTDRTMFVYDQPRRASVITGPVGGGFGLFKNWTMNYLGNLSHLAGEGFQRNNWTPLMWSMAGTSTLAGAGGIPFFFIADGFSKTFTDKSVVENMYDTMGYDKLGFAGGKAVDTLFYGFPALGGVTLQSRGEAPSADPIRDLSVLTSVAMFDRFRHVGKTISEGLEFAEATGQVPWKDPKFLNSFARAIAPRTLYRSLQVAEQGVITSLGTGSHIVHTNPVMQALHVIGFSPLELQKAYDVNSISEMSELDRQSAIQASGTAYADAMLNQDYKGAEKQLVGAIMVGLDASSIIKSAQVRMRNQSAFGIKSDITTRSDKNRQLGIGGGVPASAFGLDDFSTINK